MAKLLENTRRVHVYTCLPIVAIVELELFQHDILRFSIVHIYHSFTIVAMINQQSPRNMDRFMGVAFGSMLGTMTIGTCGSLVGIPGCRNHGVCPWGLPMRFAHGKTMAKSRISDVSSAFQWKANQKKKVHWYWIRLTCFERPVSWWPGIFLKLRQWHVRFF